MSKNWALAKVVEEVKKSSSKWLKDEGIKHFKRQIGYGAFSISSSKVYVISKYIDNQHSHHKTQDYKDEIEKFLKEYDIIEYDNKYFWE